MIPNCSAIEKLALSPNINVNITFWVTLNHTESAKQHFYKGLALLLGECDTKRTSFEKCDQQCFYPKVLK